MRALAERLSPPWLIITLVTIAIIWGNSLVPGTGSSGLSMAVVEAIRSFLDGFDIPSAWVTNFLIRKAAHFSEYAFLGIVASQAFDRDRTRLPISIISTVALLIVVPCMDETIQLFVSGRSGQISDVLLDCTGAAVGMTCRYLWARRTSMGTA
ncbi:MAG: VanZ family protein [Collinsella sp.]|nr:VanZ family protein [Collinsella sp.]